MKSLQDIQVEIGEWAQQQFGDNVSKDTSAAHYGDTLWEIPSFYGMISELGELAALDVRAMQGRSKLGGPSQIQEAREDALADCLVFMCDYAYRQNIDLNVVLDRVWEKVRQRRQATWEEDKAKEQPLTGCEATALAREAYKGKEQPLDKAGEQLRRPLTREQQLRLTSERLRKEERATHGAGCEEGNHEWATGVSCGKMVRMCKLCGQIQNPGG